LGFNSAVQLVVTAGLLVFLLFLAGCNIGNIPYDALQALDEGINQLDKQSADWQKVVQETVDKLIKAGHQAIANDVSDALARVTQDAGLEARCGLDFVRDRVREDLLHIRAKWTKKPVELIPHFCQPNHLSVDMSQPAEQRTVLAIDGYNLDAPIKVFLQDRQGNETKEIDVSDHLTHPSPYLLTLNISSNGVPLTSSSERIVFRLGGNASQSISVTQPPTPTPTPVPDLITSLRFTYFVGDEDKDNDDGHVGAEVQLDGRILADGFTEGPGDPDTVWKDETTHGPYNLPLSPPAPWSRAQEMKVAIWHRRDGGSPAWRFRVQIDAVLNNNEDDTRRVLDFFDNERFFNHKPSDRKWHTFDLRGRRGERLITPFFPIGPK